MLYLPWFLACVLFAIVCDLCTVCHGFVACVLFAMVCCLYTIGHCLRLVYFLSGFVARVLFAMVCSLFPIDIIGGYVL